MKSKLFSVLLFMSISIYAEEFKDSLYACKPSDLQSIVSDNRYFKVNPRIYADSKSIQIDHKNKRIKVWKLWLASDVQRDELLNEEKHYDYSNYGYSKTLMIIDYKNIRSKLLHSIDYNCDESVILDLPHKSDWDNIVPESVGEIFTESIIKKYKLK